MSARFFSACIAAACLVAACRGATTANLTIATTTSVVNSGLLETLLPPFKKDSGITVRVHAVGSGQALAMLERGDVQLVISHAPVAEAEYIARHPDWVYSKIAFNEFVIVGPQADPATIASATSAVDAFQRIADNGAAFISRGDSSGTHERERSLWTAANRTSPHIATSGGSMAVTLRQANETRAYTLSDEATYRQLEPQLDIKILFKGDERLLNTYAVIAPRAGAEGSVFATWLRGRGQDLIAHHMIGGIAGFHRWPAACPGDSPAALPCR